MLNAPSPTTCKFLRISLLSIFTTQMSIGMYLAFEHFSIVGFLIWCITGSSVYFWIVNQITAISCYRLQNNMLILKKVANKTDLMPLDQALINPMYVSQKIVVIRIKYHLDGIRKSAVILTNLKEFRKIKKRQAISRVL